MKTLEERGAENIEFVTATHYSAQVLYALKKYKPSVPVVWNSSGYEKVETLRLFEGLVDVYLPDLKFFDPELSLRYANCPDYFEVAFSAIREMRRQSGGCVFDENGKLLRGTLIRHLVLPSHIHDSFEILKRVAAELPRDVYVSLLCQYFPTAANIPKFRGNSNGKSIRLSLTVFCLSGLKTALCRNFRAQRKVMSPFGIYSRLYNMS